MKRVKLTIATMGVVLAAVTFAGDDIETDLARCAAVPDEPSRLQCYDAMSRRYAVATEKSGNLAPPPDELGSEQLPSSGDNDEKEAAQRLTVRAVRCEKGPRDKYYFYLEGGQVWKQVSDKRLNYKECDFNVTISKDFFGYKMQVEGEKSKTRISRIR